MIKFYRDEAGAYIGAFDGVDPPIGSIETDAAPAHSEQTWVNGEWSGSSAPAVVSRAQGIMALYMEGSLGAVEAAVASASAETQIAWATVGEFHRDSPMIAALATGVGLDLDALFIAAETIKL